MPINIPLSLYIHIPWCVRKCPYCDFNSHQSRGDLPESLYVAALLQELDAQLPFIDKRPLISIFFGGGTPSLFSGKAISDILNGVLKKLAFAPNIEITLEANPGTIDYARFHDFYQAGINRLSLGIQSLQDDKLKSLGRIHNSEHAKQAIASAKKAGFDNFNLDIMYGLPNQTIDDALYDIKTALQHEPTHFSWYQLTIEPNTLFYHQTPALPPDDLTWDMQLAGQSLLHDAGLSQYEVSAYARTGQRCLHNLNYWEFGDYLGIGAGAHSKITTSDTADIMRFAQVKHPRDYLDKTKRDAQQWQRVSKENVLFEFMLNALRLTNGFSRKLLDRAPIVNFDTLAKAEEQGLLTIDNERICPTELGKRYLNDLVGMFL